MVERSGEYSTRVCTWVIGQTGIGNCMLIHIICYPCLSDHPRTYPSTADQRVRPVWQGSGESRRKIPARIVMRGFPAKLNHGYGELEF